MRQKENSGIVAVFDLDNTLLDSGEKLKGDVAEAMQRLGVSIDIGEVNGDWYELAERYGVSRYEFDAELKKRKSWEQAFRDGDVRLFPDAEGCLDRLRDRGIVLGLLTRSTEDYTREKLKYSGLDEYFGDRVKVTPVNSPAKFPEALDLIRQLGLQVEKVYFVGDKQKDVKPAQYVTRELGIPSEGILVDRTGRALQENITCARSLDEVADYILQGGVGWNKK